MAPLCCLKAALAPRRWAHCWLLRPPAQPAASAGAACLRATSACPASRLPREPAASGRALMDGTASLLERVGSDACGTARLSRTQSGLL